MINQSENVSLHDITHLSKHDNIEEQAVCVRHAYKHYGSKKKQLVLDNLNMTVPKGSIYGLLGASGCGKTTLLGCMIGRRKLNSGEIWVLGCTPGSRRSGVPGVRIGYMPQELKLSGEFSIRETLHYFGGIAGMTNKKIDKRLKILVELLMLPDASKFVVNLSGGQQRRVSLAAALLHEPELLVLDEPTVGVDPLLRKVIWDHLVNITQSGSTTVIITTHYIDETNQATLIGLMRGGYFLAEETPKNLLSIYNTTNLEEVFLRLSMKQNLTTQEETGITNESTDIDSLSRFGDRLMKHTNSQQLDKESAQLNYTQKLRPKTKISYYLPRLNGHHMKALIWMNALWMFRNSAFLIIVICLPIVQITLFCFTIGHDPRGLPLAVVNYETNKTDTCDLIVTCNTTTLSCVYLTYLKKLDLNLVYYDTGYEATQSVLTGKTYASIVIKQNYTNALQARIDSGIDADLWDIKASEIDVLCDVTSKDITTFLKARFYETFQKFIQDYLISCGISRHVVSVPIQWKTPIYGVMQPNFLDFASPGMVVTVNFFIGTALTVIIMILQKNQGSTERSLVIGVTPLELLTVHMICQFMIMTIQIFLVLVWAFVIFKLTMNGSYLLLICISLLAGFCGMCFGLAISCAVDSEQLATYIGIGSFFPFVFLSGMIWPVEGMHYILQWCSFVTPLTIATESLRGILQRGWGLSSQVVYMGFISMSLWAIIFLMLSIIFLKFKKN